MIRLQGITYQYPSSLIPTIENVSFHIGRGECVGLLGPSGSGKSTLASIAAGFVIPKAGEVVVDGAVTTGKPSRKIMLLNQESDLFPWQTVISHIRFAQAVKDAVQIQKLINLVQLQGNEHKYPNQLSGGMKKRLSLARALAVNPAVLILDEAFSSLDSGLKSVLYADLKRIWEEIGTTILLITHDIDDVNHFAQRIFKLCGKPAHLIEHEM